MDDPIHGIGWSLSSVYLKKKKKRRREKPAVKTERTLLLVLHCAAAISAFHSIQLKALINFCTLFFCQWIESTLLAADYKSNGHNGRWSFMGESVVDGSKEGDGSKTCWCVDGMVQISLIEGIYEETALKYVLNPPQTVSEAQIWPWSSSIYFWSGKLLKFS